MTALAGWQNFYVIVGSSAGALIGLQFVVLSLISQARPARSDPAAGYAFATPTIVHLGSVLVLSAILTAPWELLPPAALVWGALGLAGIVYMVVVTRKIRRQRAYVPEFEDWAFHVVLPAGAYGSLVAAAWAARSRPREVLFGVGAAALVLLVAGIHNAWDAVTYHVFVRRKGNEHR